ncbi:MAG: hypothetical protein ACLRIS_04010 [Flavonifractor plautii]
MSTILDADLILVLDEGGWWAPAPTGVAGDLPGLPGHRGQSDAERGA